MAAARTIAAWATTLDPRRHPGGRAGGREAPRARHDRLRPRRARDRRGARGPHHDGRAGRHPPGDGDRPRRSTSRGERGLRERDALSRPRLRRHALGLGQPRVDGDRAGRSRGSRGARCEREGRAGGDRRRERDRLPHRDGGVRRVPRARLPPDRDLRDLRRRWRGEPPGRARRGRDDERARNRRLVRRRTLRVPRRRDADEAHAPGVGGARRAPGDPARDARGVRPGLRARGEVRPLPRVPRGRGGRDRHRRGARRPRLPLGDVADRLQAVPRLPLHAREPRRGGGGSGRTHVCARTRSRTCW